MKTLLFLAATITACVSCYSAEMSNNSVNLKNGNVLRIDYHLVPQPEESIQTLYLKEGKNESVVSSLPAKHQIDSLGAIGRPYEKCGIVAADLKANELLVLYALEKGRQEVFPVRQIPVAVQRPITVEKDRLLVLYRRDQGKWKTGFSVYIQSLWGDIIGEEVSSIGFAGDQNYEISFVRDWAIETLLFERRKVPKPRGAKIKTLSSDGEFVYAIDDLGEKFFTLDATWWIGDNEDYIEAKTVLNSSRREMAMAAQAKGLKAPDVNEVLLKKLRKKNIPIRMFEYFKEANDSEKALKRHIKTRENDAE